MMELFISLLIVLMLGACSSLLTVFVDFCFNQGNILDWYYAWVMDSIEPKYPKLAKAMGGCIICFGTWLAIGLFHLYLLLLPAYIPYIWILPYLGISTFINLKLAKII